MMRPLKQNTATTILVGPFVDIDGGALTGLTLSQADVQLWKEGGTTTAQKNDSTTCTDRGNGMYTCPINTTDTNTLGILEVTVLDAGALPYSKTFNVVPANVWDSMFGSDKLQVDAVEINSIAAAAQKAAISFNVMALGTVVS